MDESLEVSGKTVEEAIENGLRHLGLVRDEADVVVLNRGRPGILGIGAEAARVRVAPRSMAIVGPDDATRANELLSTLLRMMGVEATVSVASAVEEVPILLEIEGPDAALLIGRRGSTLQDLQSLLTTMVSHSLKRYVPLRVDVEGYRARHMETIRQLALRAAERVQQRGSPITLEPMSPAERREVHTALADNPDVQTQSSGEGEERRVTIYSRASARPEPPSAPGRYGLRPGFRPSYGGVPPISTGRPAPPPRPDLFPPDEEEDAEDERPPR